MNRREFLGSAALAAAAPQRPNILLFFPDQWRFEWTGFTPGLPVKTPHLEALAKRGVRFTRAVVASPLCAPSRACLASGKEYPRARVANNGDDYPLDQTTFYQLLRGHGYHVLGCGKFDLHKKTEDWGLDGKRLVPEWGFSDGVDNAGKHDAVRSGAKKPKDPYMAFLHRRGLAAAHVADFEKRKGHAATFPTTLPDDAYCDNWLSDTGLELLRRAPAAQPWFLQVNFTGPHEPLDITVSMEQRARGRHFPAPNRSTEYDAATHNAIRENYTAMIENIDRWMGIYLDAVRRRGELDNTLVVFASDHGEMLGDHNLWGKVVPYHPSVSVPLVAAGPGVKRGARTDALVSVMDLAATFLDYAGVARPADMDSRSLRPVLEGKARAHRDYLLSGLNQWRMVWDGRYKLVTGYKDRHADAALAPAPLLFDLQRDPLENENIAEKNPEQVARLMKLLAAT